MKTTLPAFVIVLALVGCSGSGSATTENIDGTIPLTPALEPMTGEWASDGDLALIVERNGENILIRNPPNDTWRFEISEIGTDGNSITFTQRNYLSDGTPHPFNGIPCECTISPISNDRDSLNYKLTSPQLPDGESDVFTRLR